MCKKLVDMEVKKLKPNEKISIKMEGSSKDFLSMALLDIARQILTHVTKNEEYVLLDDSRFSLIKEPESTKLASQVIK